MSGVQKALGLDGEQAAAVVDDYADAKKAQAELYRIKAETDLFSVIGGEQNYDGLVKWAQANPDPRRDRGSRPVGGQRPPGYQSLEGMQDALRALQSRRAASQGTPRTVVESDGAPPSTEPPIMSRQEHVALISVPEYDTDPSYRERVRNRLAAGMATGKFRD